MPVRWIWLLAAAASLMGAEDTRSEGTRLNNEAARLYAAGQFEKAERLYTQALNLKAGDEIAIAKIVSNLAALYKHQDRYAKAEAQYRRAIELRRKHWGPSHPDVAISMNNLADIYRVEGRYWEARNLLREAIQILDRSSAQNDDLPVVLSNLAVVERMNGRYDDAENLLRRALSLSERLLGSGVRQIAIASNNLAQILEDKRDFENAQLFYSRALLIFNDCACRTDSAITLANLGRLYTGEGRYAEAEHVERDALALLAESPHSVALLRAAIFQNLANIYAVSGESKLALGLFEQSLTIRESILGARHPAIADLLGDYSEAALRAGKTSEAKRLRQRARSLIALRNQEKFARFTVDIGELRSLR